MRLKKLYKKTFSQGNVIVCGLRGCGKDMLTANIIARFNKCYISNFDYKCKSNYIPLDFSNLDCGGNTYKNLITGDIRYYKYPYPHGADIYVSDAGIYFPSQYCNELNRDFRFMPMFQALSRQLGHGTNFHCNVQSISRLYDKIREQADTYITCNWCKVLFGRFVFQSITIFDKYDSCLNRVQPFKPLKIPLTINGTAKALYRTKNEELYRSYCERNGSVKKKFLFYINKSNYDTYYFDKLFQGGVQYEKNKRFF